MTIALIDGDIIAYRCSASAENDPQEIAEVRANDLIRRILHETNTEDYQLYLSGSNNFRYEIYPDYKANRRDKPRPKHLEAIQEYLVTYWKAKVTNGYEADDALGIDQTTYSLESVICSIDKDLLQIPGHHYNFVKQYNSFVSPFDGLRSFYRSVLAGDGADHIPGFDGKFRNTVPQFIEKMQEPLASMTEEKDMYEYCLTHYTDQELMNRNCKLLWILREPESHWKCPTQ